MRGKRGNMKYRTIKGVVVCLGFVGIAIAEESLSREFLDYLVEFDDVAGEWVDPMELDMMIQLNTQTEVVPGNHDMSSEVLPTEEVENE